MLPRRVNPYRGKNHYFRPRKYVRYLDQDRRSVPAHQRIQILRPSLPHRAKTSVHSRPYNANWRGEVNPISSAFHAPRQRHVFQYLPCNRRMSAEFFIHISEQQQKLSVGRRIRPTRIVHLRERKFVGQPAINEWNQRAFPEGIQFLFRRVRKPELRRELQHRKALAVLTCANGMCLRQ